MISCEHLTVEHVLAVGSRLQSAQQAVVEPISPAYAAHVIALPGIGWAVVEDGTPIACGGIATAWPGRGMSWSLMTDQAFDRFKPIHRLVTQVLDDAPWTRIEADVDAAHAAGCRWAERLGFVKEGVRRKFTPDGRDMVLYARVK